VALVAGHTGVLAFEQVAGFSVVKGLGVPLDQGKVFPVMLGVAACALLAGAGRNVIGGVQAFAGGEPGGYLAVTLQTFQSRLPTELVATCAVRGSVQRLVRSRQRAGRNLSRRRSGDQGQQT